MRPNLLSAALAASALAAACGGGGGASPASPSIGDGTAGEPSAAAGTGGPAVDARKLALVRRDGGFGDLRVSPTSEVAPANGGGDFRTACSFSHMSYDDPIVYPGQKGRSHLHTFFGNTGVDAESTADSIGTTGNSTCRGGIANRSAYWVPTMIDTRDGTPLVPAGIGVYYKHGAVAGRLVQPIPAGLRMIAGDPGASGPKSEFSSRFKCIGGPNGQNALYQPTIGNCDAGAELWMEIFFPPCWDGRNLDSPDHKSHMSYHVHDRTAGYHCPASHPVPLPSITFNVVYVVPEKDAPLRWRLASDAYDTSIPGGYSAHGDWFNGWKGEVSDAWAKHCVQAERDCHSHLLGDGRQIH